MTKLTIFPFCLLCLILLTTAVLASKLQAQTFESNFTEAKALSEKQEKPLMLVFSGSDWCKPCILLKREVLSSPEFAAFQQENLVVLNLDFPFRKKNALPAEQQKHNDALAEKYNPTGVFPLVVILDENGQVTQRLEYKMNMEPTSFISQIN